MPGPQTIRFLAPANYETFYQLAHTLSKHVLVSMVDISTRAQVLDRLHKMTPLENFSDPPAADMAGTVIMHLQEYAQSATEEIRRFFWPRLAIEKGFHAANQRRWSPYDEQAWDAFFEDFVLLMQPRLRTITTIIQQLQTAESLRGVALKPDGSENIWTIGEYIPDKSCRRLEQLLDEAEFEAILFAV